MASAALPPAAGWSREGLADLQGAAGRGGMALPGRHEERRAALKGKKRPQRNRGDCAPRTTRVFLAANIGKWVRRGF
jgi:hypothetical protein